jgi:NAD(P)-dependent dehydrogenase (short-subunit alcohol dehydrogenase family)
MKIALITGGNRGLGKSTAEQVAKRGTGVVITYNSHADEAHEVVRQIEKRGGRALALKLDVTNAASFPTFATQLTQAIFQKWNTKTFDYLVNNAGFMAFASHQETTSEQFDQMMNVHLKGPFFLVQALSQQMNIEGHIINISTGLTRFTTAGACAYATMKGGVEVMTKYMANELGPKKIRVNCVAPGAIETDFANGMVRDNAEINKHISSTTALGRVGLPDDIGLFIASLLCEDSRWINAQRIEASGGHNL